MFCNQNFLSETVNKVVLYTHICMNTCTHIHTHTHTVNAYMKLIWGNPWHTSACHESLQLVLYIYMYIYIYICIYICIYIYIYIYNIYIIERKDKRTHFNFSQIFRLFSKPSPVCADKALNEKFIYTAGNQKLIKWTDKIKENIRVHV